MVYGCTIVNFTHEKREEYSEPRQTSKMETSAKKVNKKLIILVPLVLVILF